MPWGGAGGVGGAGFGLLWSLLWLLVVVALLVGVAYLALRFLRDRETDADSDALAVLRGRYARGDIDGDEFDRRYDRLTGESPPAGRSSQPDESSL